MLETTFTVKGVTQKNKYYVTSNLQVHHIKPRSDYPELVYEHSNLVTLCQSCNTSLGKKGIDFEWTVPEDTHEYCL